MFFWVVINHTQPKKGHTHTHTHPHSAQKMLHSPTPSHTQPQKGHTHPHPPTPSQEEVTLKCPAKKTS